MMTIMRLRDNMGIMGTVESGAALGTQVIASNATIGATHNLTKAARMKHRKKRSRKSYA